MALNYLLLLSFAQLSLQFEIPCGSQCKCLDMKEFVLVDCKSLDWTSIQDNLPSTKPVYLLLAVNISCEGLLNLETLRQNIVSVTVKNKPIRLNCPCKSKLNSNSCSNTEKSNVIHRAVSTRVPKTHESTFKSQETSATQETNSLKELNQQPYHSKRFIQWTIGSSFGTLCLVLCICIGIKCKTAYIKRRNQRRILPEFLNFELYNLNEDDDEVVIYNSTSV